MQAECPNFAARRSGVERIYNDLRFSMTGSRVAQDQFGKRRPSFAFRAPATSGFAISERLPRRQL